MAIQKGEKKPCNVPIADFPGVNTPTMVNFKLPPGCH